MVVKRIDLVFSDGIEGAYGVFLNVYLNCQHSPASTFLGKYNGSREKAIKGIVRDTKKLLRSPSYSGVSEIGVTGDFRLTEEFNKAIFGGLEKSLKKLNISLLKE